MASLLVVDDERSMREFLAICLKRAGHDVTVADGGDKALAAMDQAEREFDLVISDLKMPGKLGGLDLLDQIKKRWPSTQVIMMTAFATAATAIHAMKRGAYDYLTKPFKVDEIAVVVNRALERQVLVRQNVELRERVQGGYRLSLMLGKSPAMQRVFEMVRKVAPTRTNVLVTGESGTGKELVARALHSEGPRSAQAFVAVNCGAIPHTLLESELFGHKKGAFTGASHDKEGLFEAAHEGTLFLDEIGELPLAMQVKLLRAVQERKIKPVGGVEERPVDVRIIAATNLDLEQAVADGTFRQDLFYRLNVIQIGVPALRHRLDDVPLLAHLFLSRYAAETGKHIDDFEPGAMAMLCDYGYPGNVRELENIVERAVTLGSTGRISIDEMPALGSRADPTAGVLGTFPSEGVNLDRILGEFETQWLKKALEKTGGGKKAAAELLGISFRSLRYRLDKLGFQTDD